MEFRVVVDVSDIRRGLRDVLRDLEVLGFITQRGGAWFSINEGRLHEFMVRCHELSVASYIVDDGYRKLIDERIGDKALLALTLISSCLGYELTVWFNAHGIPITTPNENFIGRLTGALLGVMIIHHYGLRRTRRMLLRTIEMALDGEVDVGDIPLMRDFIMSIGGFRGLVLRS